MKVGIVTYYDIANYGSVLQAYALKSVLQKMNIEACFLNVREKALIPKYAHKFYVGVITAYKMLIYKNARTTHAEIRRLKAETQEAVSFDVRTAFSQFIKENLPSITIGRTALKKMAHSNQFYSFICGSDQIWSPLSLHLPSYKFLKFAPFEKRIAYGPSFGVGYIPAYNRGFIKKALLGMKCISVRETQGADLVDSLISYKPQVVLDPTMLLTGEQWRGLYKNHMDDVSYSSYSLAYFFDEPNEHIVDSIIAEVKKRGQELIVIVKNNISLIERGARYVASGPWEFLSLVDNAEHVFTNSFHCCVFSVLFNKPFTAFDRRHSSNVKQTSRITTLLEIAGLESCFYPNCSLYHSVLKINTGNIIKKRNDSLSYLISALNLENTNE